VSGGERVGPAGRAVLDAGAVLRGAAVAVVVCLPLALVSQALADADGGDAAVVVLFFAVLAGLALGGFVAARVAGTAPYSNGGVAAAAAFVAIQGTALVVRALLGDGGDGPTVPGVVFNALLAYGCGLAGGAVASRWRRGGDR
jgi:hypothetical protein